MDSKNYKGKIMKKMMEHRMKSHEYTILYTLFLTM